MLHSSRYASGFTVSLVACACLNTVLFTDSYNVDYKNYIYPLYNGYYDACGCSLLERGQLHARCVLTRMREYTMDFYGSTSAAVARSAAQAASLAVGNLRAYYLSYTRFRV